MASVPTVLTVLLQEGLIYQFSNDKEAHKHRSAAQVSIAGKWQGRDETHLGEPELTRTQQHHCGVRAHVSASPQGREEDLNEGLWEHRASVCMPSADVLREICQNHLYFWKRNVLAKGENSYLWALFSDKR